MTRSRPQSLLDELTRLEKLRNPDAKDRRRQFQRHIVRGDAELVNMDRIDVDEPPMLVLLRDVSRNGIGFISDDELDVGSTWRLRFLQRRYVIGHVSIVIRHCRNVNNVHLVGSQICFANGVLYMLGVDPADVREGDNPTITSASAAFLAPGDVD